MRTEYGTGRFSPPDFRGGDVQLVQQAPQGRAVAASDQSALRSAARNCRTCSWFCHVWVITRRLLTLWMRPYEPPVASQDSGRIDCAISVTSWATSPRQLPRL